MSLITLMLKIIKLLDMPIFEKNESKSEVVRFNIGNQSDEIANKP